MTNNFKFSLFNRIFSIRKKGSPSCYRTAALAEFFENQLYPGLTVSYEFYAMSLKMLLMVSICFTLLYQSTLMAVWRNSTGSDNWVFFSVTFF